MYRVPQFLEKCGNISDVNCQPVEKITTDSHGCFIMAHEKVAGTPDTQFRSWRKKMESCLRDCTNSTELKSWMMTRVA